MGPVSYSYSQPVYVRFGHASRRRNHGSSGSECGPQNPCGVEALMPKASERIVVIGGGANGLVAAFYLAKAGHSTLVLERRNIVGGTLVTEEIHPGFRCPTVLHSTGPIPPGILRDMQLE